jgi:hypothetical protein
MSGAYDFDTKGSRRQGETAVMRRHGEILPRSLTPYERGGEV